MRRVVPLLLLLTLAACNKLPPEQKTALLAKLDQAVAAAEALEAGRSAGVLAYAGLPRMPESTCSEVIMLDSLGEPINNQRTPMQGSGNYVHAEGGVGDLAAQAGTRIKRARRDAALLRSQITGEGLVGAEAFDADSVDWAEQRIARLASSSWYRYDIHYVILEQRKGIERKGVKYPSFVSGRAIVWDYAKGKVACAASAQKSLGAGDSVMVTYVKSAGAQEQDYVAAYKYGLLHDVAGTAMKKIGLGTAYADSPDPAYQD